MKITDDMKSIKSLKGLLKLVKSYGSDAHIETLKYSRLYWIYLGHDTTNVFIQLNCDGSGKPEVSFTERYLTFGDDDKFILGESLSKQVSKLGKEDMLLAFHQYQTTRKIA